MENTCSLDDHILNLEIGGLLPDFQGGGELPVYGGPTEGLFSTQALPKEIGSQLQCSAGARFLKYQFKPKCLARSESYTSCLIVNTLPPSPCAIYFPCRMIDMCGL